MQIKKKRLEKFKQHTRGIFAPFVTEIANGRAFEFNHLVRAINGIIYQHTGDEDQYLKRDEVTLGGQIACLEETIDNYNKMDDEEKDFLSSGEMDEEKIVNAILTQLVFRTIHKKRPSYFFYSEKKQKESTDAQSENPDTKE